LRWASCAVVEKERFLTIPPIKTNGREDESWSKGRMDGVGSKGKEGCVSCNWVSGEGAAYKGIIEDSCGVGDIASSWVATERNYFIESCKELIIEEK
jgi:hypothetical protein